MRFEVLTSVEPATRCNCSLCRRRGALMTPAFPEANLRILAGRDALTLYQFNTRVAQHYFCKHCGIYPFHAARTMPGMWRANVGCLEDVADPYAIDHGVADGKTLSVVEDA
ncbi:GFA family protein [Pandoraea captiosa]|uniref:GFA family protein n=1 Tax=Pandoraea captiosa TaxID=2508302 RepID=UPI001FE6986F|nr:GFA family protein [Pandoraea captiosa]